MPKAAALKMFPLAAHLDEKGYQAELTNAGVPSEGLSGWECTRGFNWWVLASKQGLPLVAARPLHSAQGKNLLPLGQTRVKDIAELSNAAGAISFYHAKTPAALKALVTAIGGKPAA